MSSVDTGQSPLPKTHCPMTVVRLQRVLLNAGLVIGAGVLAFWGGRAMARHRMVQVSAARAHEGAHPHSNEAHSANLYARDRPAPSRRPALPAERPITPEASTWVSPREEGGTPLQVARSTRQETPIERAERHRRIIERLKDTLGGVSPEKQAALLALNDEATEVDRALMQNFLDGDISHEQYMTEYRQAKLSQLADLRRLVTSWEYESITGLEVDTDPFEYMETGEGAALHSVHECAPPEDVTDATGVDKDD